MVLFLPPDSKDGPLDTSPTSSPLPKLDDKIAASFPTGKPRDHDLLETVICKHCKRPALKSSAPEHIRGCLKAKQEKARKKKEARDAANRAKAGDVGDIDEKDGPEDSMKGQKSAKKSAVKGTEDGTKKGKKRKADEDDTKPKKKKKDEPKAKTAKPKGPVDVEKQCGVTLPNGAQCARSLTCKSHSMGAKRAVPGRSLPYDMLLQQYQKKNQARQQSMWFPSLLPSSNIENVWTNVFCSHLQRLPSTPMLRCRKTWKLAGPSILTKNEIPSWQLLRDPRPNPSLNIPSSLPRPSTDTFGSKSRCSTPSVVEVAALSFQPTTASHRRYSVAGICSRHSIVPSIPPHPPSSGPWTQMIKRLPARPQWQRLEWYKWDSYDLRLYLALGFHLWWNADVGVWGAGCSRITYYEHAFD